MSADHEKLMQALDIAEKVAHFISFAMSSLLILAMISDIFGINIIQMIVEAARRPPTLPPRWVEVYRPVWFGMEVALLLLVMGDQVYSYTYMQKHKTLPPVGYTRVVSLATFLLSFWLAIIMKYMSFTLIAVFSLISLLYTTLGRRE